MTKTLSIREGFSCAILLPLLLLLTTGNLPAPQNRHIESVPTRAGTRGTTVDVLIQGNYINDPREIIFYRPGIKAIEIKEIEDLEHPINLAHSSDAIVQQVTSKFVIAPDCPVGEHQFKLRTGTQLSTLSTFWVTPFPIHIAIEPNGKMGLNDTPEAAEALPRESTSVLAKIDTGKTSDVDCYRVNRKKGERISVEIDSVRLTEIHYGESEFDLAVRILDTTGRELASADDSSLHIQDPILSIIAPADGDYIIEVTQRLYKGSQFCHYLAHIGDFERPLAVYPAGGESGKAQKVTLLGDPAGEIERIIELPKRNRSGDFEYRNEAPSHLPMRVSPYPNTDEAAKPSGPANLPVAFNGIISSPTEKDIFRFIAKKDLTYRIRSFGRGIGTPLDPKVEILDPETGNVLAAEDDATHAERGMWAVANSFQFPCLLDPSFTWKPERDGEFELRISDMRGLGGPTYVYRVEFEPVGNEVHTWMYASVIDSAECSKITSVTVPQNNRWTTTVRIADGQGSPWKGEVRLVPRGLPPGIQMNTAVIPPGEKETLVEFVAQPGAEPQAGVFRIAAEAVDGTSLASDSQQAMPFLSHSGARAWHTVIVDQYAYAITDPAPFRLEVESPQIPLSKNGEMKVNLTLHRKPGFTEPVEVNAYWVPKGVTAQPAARFEEGKTELEFSFSANSSVQPSTHSIALQATTLRGIYFNGVGDIRVSSPFFPLEIAEPYVELSSSPVSIRRTQKGEFRFSVKHMKPFRGGAEVILLGLPKGVTAETATLGASDGEVVFKLHAEGDALLGLYKQISCELTVHEGGQAIRQRSGNGTLRIDPALSQ